MALSTWLTFFLASWAISLSPGPKTLATMNVADVRYSFHHLLLLDDQLVR